MSLGHLGIVGSCSDVHVASDLRIELSSSGIQLWTSSMLVVTLVLKIHILYDKKVIKSLLSVAGLPTPHTTLLSSWVVSLCHVHICVSNPCTYAVHVQS